MEINNFNMKLGNRGGGGNFRDRFDRHGDDDRDNDRGGYNNRRNDGRDNGGRNSMR